MYLRKLTIDHLKRISHLELDFTTPRGKPRMWTVLIGENGTAKTSILQAIALLAAGKLDAHALSRPVFRHLRDRRADAPMAISADFEFTERGQAPHDPDLHPTIPTAGVTVDGRLGLRSRLSLERDSTRLVGEATYLSSDTPVRFSDLDPLEHARDQGTLLWFVAAYGVARALPEVSFTPSLDRPPLERLETLFNPRASLVGTAFSNYFALNPEAAATEEGKKKARRFHRVLKKALLSVDSLLPDIKDLELRGQGGVVQAGDLMERDRFRQRMGSGDLMVPAVALSHGYQSIIAWIADLVGHVILEADDELSTKDMQGLVLIDEIDLYLHPKWQAAVVPALRETFPKLQFVCTTHSPLVLAGLNPDEVIRLGVTEPSGDVAPMAFDQAGHITSDLGQEGLIHLDPRPMTGSELYRQFFGLDELTPLDEGAKLRRYQLLSGDPFRSEEEDAEMRRLALELREADYKIPRAMKRRA